MDCPSLNEKKTGNYEPYQHQAITAILERPTFQHFCFLTQLTETPGQPRPEELAFAVKGLLRCNFRQAPQGLKWRRLFGTTKNRWHKEEWKKLPLSWRSRVLFQTFQTREEAQTALASCPLRQWSSQTACPLVAELTAGNDGQPWVLLQVEDVKLDDSHTFSQKLAAFLQSKASVFTYRHHCSCPDLQNLAPAGSPPAANPVSSPVKIVWRFQPLSPLHTGVSLDFAKAFHGQQREPHSRNLRLSQPQNPAQLTPALLVSSLKGVWRSAFAWLVEKIAREQGLADQQSPMTADYWQGKEEDYAKKCPVRAIFGGPLPQRKMTAGQEVSKDQAAARGLVRFLASAGSYWPATVRTDWCEDAARFRFARKLLQDKQRDQALLHIETINLDEDSWVITEIQPGPHALPALIALCLAADLISAGFFRVGRFTSRGFGLVRLKPVSVCSGSLVDFLEDRAAELPGADSGFQLLSETFKITDPLGELAGWLQEIAAAGQGEAP